MKTPQRKFVVEIKSAGRRSSAVRGSIWGNTDLKSFVRQAETDAPQLFEPPVAPPAPHEEGSAASTFGAPSDIVEHPESDVAFVESAQSVSPEVEPPVLVSPSGEVVADVETEEPADELAALESENRHLKRLLADHIRQENDRLRAMLERFDSF